MTVDTLDRFLTDVEHALTRAFGLDACEIRLPGRARRIGDDSEPNPHSAEIPLRSENQEIGCVVINRSGAPLSDQERATLSSRMAVVAERIALMQNHQWPPVRDEIALDPDERARAERDEFESLLRSQQIVSRQEATDATLNAIVLELERILPLVTAHIYTVDHEAHVLVNRVSRTSGSPYHETFSEIPIGTGLLGSVIENGEAAQILNSHLDHRSFYPPKVEPLIRLLGESAMVAPLRSRGRVSGAIFVNRLGHREFTEHEFRLFRLFAGHVELAFDKALRLEVERKSRRSAETLSALATTLAGVDSEHVLIRSVTETVRDLTGAQCVSVSVMDRSRQNPLEASVIDDGEVEISRPMTSSKPQVVSAPNGAHRETVRNYGELHPTLASVIHPEDFVSALSIPIVGSSGFLGQIWAASSGRRLSTQTVPEYLESLASIAAVNLERIRARDLASELEGTIDVLTRSSRIALDAQFDEEAVCELVSLLEDIVSARAITAWLSDPHDMSERDADLRLVAFRGPQELSARYAGNELSAALGTLAEAWTTGALVLCDEALALLPQEAQRQCRELKIGALAAFRLADHERDYGVVRIDYGSGTELPSEHVLRLVRGVVDQFSLGLGAIRMRERWMDLYRSSVEALAATVDAKDPFTHTHSRNVAFYSRLLAQRLGLPENQVQQIELAGLLHDIGKISIADRILSKTEPLDPHERMEMMAHPVRGAEILAGDEGLAGLVPIVRHHHERHDGLGYPDGLSGSDIPLGAAIVGVADAVDTMLNDRSYARRRTLDEVRSEVRAASGTQFNPLVAEAFLELIDEAPMQLRVRDDDGYDVVQVAGVRDHLPVADVAQVRVISRLAQELSALTDLSTFVRGACSIVAEELGYDRVEICMDPVRPNSLSLGIVDEVPCTPVCEVISRSVIRENRVVNIPDLSLIPDLDSDAPTGSALSVPLRVEEYSIGSLCVASDQPSSFTIVDEALLTVAASQLSAGLRVAQLHDHVKWTARHDALTQALDHGAFYEELSRAIDLHQETSEPVSLILCDVEGLKGVNDRLGHLAGDSVLRLLVRRIREIVRSRDLIARYGGDEFAIITFGTTREDATALTARLHDSLRDEPLLGVGAITQVTTGIAQVGEDGLTPAELVRIADHRLYETRGRR
jgi:diguanylate cyclase (GGDEF)-like protein